MRRLDGTVCRVCLRSKGTVALFDGRGTNEIFSYVTLLTVKKDDGLPTNLCEECVGHMRSAYDFRFQANYAEEYFRKTIFLPVTTKREEETQQFEPCATAGQELVVLDENMQAIEELLLKHDETVDGMRAEEVLIDSEIITSKQADDKGKNCKEIDLCCPLTNTSLSPTQLVTNENASCDIIPVTSKSIQPQVKTESNNENATPLAKQQPKRKRRCIMPSNGVIECNICGTTFTHVNSLKQHLLKHSGARPFQCEFCEKSFARRTILNIHRRLHTGERPYSCDECVQTFVTREALNRHKERVHSEEIDAEVFAVIANQPTYSCDMCNQTRNSKYSLLAHMRTHHAKAPQKQHSKYKANRKPRGVERPRRPQRLVDQDGRPLSTVKYCKICQQGFPSKWELVMHEKEHNASPIFECDVCKQFFEKKYQLLCHLQTHEHAVEKYIKRGAWGKCRLLVKAAASDDDDKPLSERLRKRKRPTTPITTGEKAPKQTKNNEINCLRCKKNFDDCISLQAHLRRHASLDRKFPCEHCGKRFYRKCVLKLHLKLHCASESVYKCPVCEDVHADKANLLHHLNNFHNTHESGECALAIPSSQQVFTDATLAEYNSETHAAVSQVSPPAALQYECNLCAYKFSKLSTYVSHLEIHAPSEPLQCSLCAATFKERFEMRFHLKLHELGEQPCKK